MMTDTAEKAQAEQAAALAAEQAAAASAEDGASKGETEAAATEAAEKAVKEVAPDLTDAQVERIANASGKAAARETVSELQRMGALREEEAADQHGGSPPPDLTQTETEIQQEPPKKLKPAERFIGRKR